MASSVHQKAKLDIAKNDLDLETATIKAVLVLSTYVDDPDVDFVDDGSANDVASHEINVTGYTGGFNGAGRKTIAGKTFSRVDAQNRIKFTCDPVLWPGLGSGATIGGVAFIREVTTDADSVVVAFDDAPNLATNGGDVTYTPSADGIFYF